VTKPGLAFLHNGRVYNLRKVDRHAAEALASEEQPVATESDDGVEPTSPLEAEQSVAQRRQLRILSQQLHKFIEQILAYSR
jgi:hypothetical protein